MTEKIFREKAPGLIRRLLKEPFGFGVEDAAAILGNAGHESGGLTILQEIKPTVEGSRGGYGWFQWTGPRRREFEAWAKSKGWMPWSDEANYSFLIRELMTTEARAVEAVKSAKGLEAKVKAFELAYERAGVKHYESRILWAQRALEAYRANEKEKEMALPTVLIPVLGQVVRAAADKVVERLAADQTSTVPEKTSDHQSKEELKTEIAKEVMKAPEIKHLTNTETYWYQKRSRWASILGIAFTVLAPLATRFGLDLNQEAQENIITICTTVGGLWAAYLSYRAGVATKPLGQ